MRLFFFNAWVGAGSSCQRRRLCLLALPQSYKEREKTEGKESNTVIWCVCVGGGGGDKEIGKGGLWQSYTGMIGPPSGCPWHQSSLMCRLHEATSKTLSGNNEAILKLFDVQAQWGNIKDPFRQQWGNIKALWCAGSMRQHQRPFQATMRQYQSSLMCRLHDATSKTLSGNNEAISKLFDVQAPWGNIKDPFRQQWGNIKALWCAGSTRQHQRPFQAIMRQYQSSLMCRLHEATSKTLSGNNEAISKLFDVQAPWGNIKDPFRQ